MAKGNGAQSEALVFDPKERIDFVKGFGKRKQERLQRAKQKAQEKEREIRKLLRQKRREALKKVRQANGRKSPNISSGGSGNGNADAVFDTGFN